MNEEKITGLEFLLDLPVKETPESKEIERLNNIIDKIEKALKDHKDIKVKAHYNEFYVEIDEMLEYIQELKENNGNKTR